MTKLLAVLNGRLSEAVSEEDWNRVLQLADEERLSPWFVSRLRALSIATTPALEAKLHAVQRDSTIAALFWCGELKGLLRAFHEEGIPVIPLKGPALAERYYGSASLRTNSDLDLLVRKRDFTQAQTLLLQLGFEAKDYDRYHQSFLRRASMVELHDDVVDPRWFDFHIEAAWERAQPNSFQGVPAFQLSADDDFLFLALHGVRHEFDHLTLVLDLALAAKTFESKQPPSFRPEVATLGGQLLLGYTMARRLLPEVCPLLVLPGADIQGSSIEALAAQLESRIFTGDVAPLHWKERNRFHREMELYSLDRLKRVCLQLQMRLKEIFGVSHRDRQFAAKLGLTHPWQHLLVRPLRVLLKAFGRRD
jgi:hypothetical protein